MCLKFSETAFAFCFVLEKLDSLLEKSVHSLMLFCCHFQLAEALYAYGRGNDEKALELLGPDFDANACKVITMSNN